MSSFCKCNISIKYFYPSHVFVVTALFCLFSYNFMQLFYRCAICYGRTNHVQAPDPISHESGKIVALLDHSYHQVLSSKNDIALDIQVWFGMVRLGLASKTIQISNIKTKQNNYLVYI